VVTRRNPTIVSRSPRQTQKLGERLGAAAGPGDVYLLAGELGSGKTCLAQGIARGLGVTEYTSSPSFVLMKEYRGRLTMYHMDLYRLDREEEMLDLGLPSYFSGAGLCVVEWAEKLGRLMPEEHLLITISYRGDRTRQLEMKARGKRYQDMLDNLTSAAQKTRRPEA
jgi:tRNA threonylcarbamoyladenosine biosynthesis protein TsaE